MHRSSVVRLLLVMTLLTSLVTNRPCAADQLSERYTEAAGRSVAGAAMLGFALSLTSDNATAALDGPIWVTLEIRNVSGGTEYAQFPPRGGFVFTIVNEATGKIVPFNPLSTFGLDSVGGPAEGRPVPPRSSMYLRFLLDKQYSFTDRGTYSVTVTTAHLNIKSARANYPYHAQHVSLHPSNTITITVV
jgi:hypothetical protein